jgi:hypothetical protein
VGDIFNNVGTSAPALLPLFRSEAQLAILGTLYVGPYRYWTISALANYIGQPVSTTHREVARLDAAGIVTVTAEGRNAYAAMDERRAIKSLVRIGSI